MNKLKEDTINACKQYGATTVRKAAILQIQGNDNYALEQVGLAGYAEEARKVRDIAFVLLMNKLEKDTNNACSQYGAFTVRKAAIRQMRGDNQALEELGLADYAEEVIDVSTLAFDLLTDAEKRADWELHYSNHDYKKSPEYGGKS